MVPLKPPSVATIQTNEKKWKDISQHLKLFHSTSFARSSQSQSLNRCCPKNLCETLLPGTVLFHDGVPRAPSVDFKVEHVSKEDMNPGSIQSQVGQGFKQPGLLKGVPAHGRG